MWTSDRPRKRAARLGLCLTTMAGSLFAYSAALAQSTGSQTVEEVVVVSKQKTSIDGLITTVETPKAKSIVTQQYIATQQPGQNLIQDLNFVPGVNYTNDDPFGMAGGGGHLRVRGIDGSRISLLIDGVPLNDTGNYAIYPGELIDPEAVAQVNINIGSTDVDSPTATAVGGLINIDTLTPTDTFGGFLNASGGNYSYRRIAGVLETGTFGPLGTKMWVEASDQEYDKYKGFGHFQKWQINTKVYQDLHHDGDFIAAALFWDNQRVPNIYSLDLATFGTKAKPADPWNLDYLGTYYSAGQTPGTAGNDNSPSYAGEPGAFSSGLGKYFYGNQVNPTNTYNVRGESRFTLLPNLHLTIDPAFQSVLADGGSQGSTLAENDPRLIGTATTFPTCKVGPAGQKGVDLNGDGDCLDTVRVFIPSLTHTQRITVNTSLIWDINPDNLIQVAYAYDHGHHRQTGEAGFLTPEGFPVSVYGGYDSTPVLGADGSAYRSRDRLSVAVLNQFSADYIGKFFDQRLRVDLGIRDPHFSRDLNQYCYSSVTSGSGVYCDTATPPANASGGPYTIPPFHSHVDYTKPLPNVGVSWRFNPANMVYFSYTEEFSAPRTDDLYTVTTAAGTGVSLDTVQPETSSTYEIGYRYQTSRILGSIALWDSEFKNRIVSTFDPDTDLSDDRNVGAVTFRGIDAQLGAKLLDHLNALATFEYMHSRVDNNVLFNAAGLVEPLDGKELVETPDITVGGRITYDWNAFVFGFQGKYTGSRWVTDLNDLKVAGYTVFDLDARVKLDHYLLGSYLQVNVQNLFNERYYGSIAGTQPTANSNSAFYGSQPYAYQGAPRTVVVTLHAAF
jgi:iron complex outermembrane receptor protein